jgi:predicted component of type VI protein secretion system
LNDSSPLNLLVGAGNDYIIKAMQAIKQIMLGSPAEHAIRTIEYLNANNAILSTINAQLVATARARQEAKKGKQVISKARVLSKEDADRLQAEKEATRAAEAAHKAHIQQKKGQIALKRAEEEVEKVERAIRRVIAKDAKEINAEIARMAKVNRRLFT